MKKFVWLSGGDPVLFDANDSDEAYRKVLAARIAVHCLDCKNPSKEMIQSCVDWSAQEDTIVEVRPMDLNEVFEGELPEDPTENTKKLTDKEKERIIKDFAEWSGGFIPEECDDSAIANYVEHGRPADICGSAVLEYLTSLSEIAGHRKIAGDDLLM